MLGRGHEEFPSLDLTQGVLVGLPAQRQNVDHKAEYDFLEHGYGYRPRVGENHEAGELVLDPEKSLHGVRDRAGQVIGEADELQVDVRRVDLKVGVLELAGEVVDGPPGIELVEPFPHSDTDLIGEQPVLRVQADCIDVDHSLNLGIAQGHQPLPAGGLGVAHPKESIRIGVPPGSIEPEEVARLQQPLLDQQLFNK